MLNTAKTAVVTPILEADIRKPCAKVSSIPCGSIPAFSPGSSANSAIAFTVGKFPTFLPVLTVKIIEAVSLSKKRVSSVSILFSIPPGRKKFPYGLFD